DCKDLWFWDTEKGSITFDPGKYIFEIGTSSRAIKGQVEAKMSGNYIPILTTVVAESNKVVLQPGDQIQTSVTAAMSDDSFYDLSKAKVVYSSNHPAVAMVDENGKVTATGVGAALIYAHVTVNGTTISNNYPLKIMPNLNPKSITINGKNILGFHKDIKAYSYLLKSNSKIPLVKAAAMGNNISVEIEQAKGIPGTTIVKLIDN